MFFFLDLETTGLDEHLCDILELGVIVTDDDLDVIAGRSWFVEPSMGDMYKDGLHVNVLEMHAKNGLFKAIDEGKGMDRHAVAARALEFCSHYAKNLSAYPLCGASVHFDRRFLRRWMPIIDSSFSHRIIDTSVIRGLATIWNHDIAKKSPEATDNLQHRVLPDLENTITTLRYYKRAFFDGARVPEFGQGVACG